MIVLDDPAGATELAADGHLSYKFAHFEFVLVVVFEDEGSGTQLVDEVELVGADFLNHLQHKGGWLVAPRNCS